MAHRFRVAHLNINTLQQLRFYGTLSSVIYSHVYVLKWYVGPCRKYRIVTRVYE